jgi:hypothetical protein
MVSWYQWVDWSYIMSEEKHEHDKFSIQIDRNRYEVEMNVLTGAELRALPTPDVPLDRDLFEVVPGGTDLKLEPTSQVTIRDGLRFFTAPGHINPGRSE